MARVWLVEETTFACRLIAIKESLYDREVKVCAALAKAKVPTEELNH